MDEKPKSIWKKPLRLPQLFLAWLGLMVVTTVILVIVMTIINTPLTKAHEVSGLFVFGAVSATILLAGWIFIRWLCCWRNFKRFLFGLACFATLIALFYAEEDWRGWHTWNSFKHEWEAKGEHFDYASIVPPAVPDDQNFALTPLVASCYEMYFNKSGQELRPRNTNVVDRMQFSVWADENLAPWPTNGGNWQKATTNNLAEWQAYYRTLAGKTNLFPVAPAPQSPGADVLLALGKFDPLIEELRTDSQLPCSRFPLTYTAESPAAILLPHLAAMKRASQFLRLRILAELEAGQPEKALDDLKLSLRLVEAVRTDPFLISHLVRIAMLQIMLQPVYEGVAEHRWSDAQLVALDAELAKLDFTRDYQLSMHGEIGGVDGEMNLIRRHPEYLPNYEDEFGNGFDDDKGGQYKEPSLPGKVFARLIPTGWFYQNEYRYVRMMMDYYLPLADAGQGTFSPALARQRDAAVKAEFQSFSPYNLLTRMMVSALNPSAKKFAHTQASVNLARTAIALERYRLAHAELPESLDALAPQFIAKVPHDVIGGQPLKYRREANDQFVLYSVGWNETDDGGVVGFSSKGQSLDNSKGDWVWRYPAK